MCTTSCKEETILGLPPEVRALLGRTVKFLGVIPFIGRPGLNPVEFCKGMTPEDAVAVLTAQFKDEHPWVCTTNCTVETLYDFPVELRMALAHVRDMNKVPLMSRSDLDLKKYCKGMSQEQMAEISGIFQ